MSLRFTASLLLTLGVVAGLNAQTRLDVLANPGFESPANAGSMGLPISGWDTDEDVVVRSIDGTPTIDDRPPEGKQFCALARLDAISQTFNPNLGAGDSLTVSFRVTDTPAVLGAWSSGFMRATLSVNGSVVQTRDYASFTGDERYETRQISFWNPEGAAPITNMTITLSNRAPLSFSTIYLPVRIDDVQVFVASRYLSRGDSLHFDFEDRGAGPFSEPATSVENWSASGAVSIVDGSGSTWMPSQGSRWTEVSTLGSDPANFFSLDSSARLRIRPDSREIRIDWTALTNETPGDTQFFDRLTMRLRDFSGSSVTTVESRTILETSDPSFTWVPSSSTSASSGVAMGNELDGRRVEIFVIDEALIGKELVLECSSANLGDSGVETVLQIDNVRGAAEVRFPGSDPDLLRMASSVRPYSSSGVPDYGILTGGPGEDRKRASGGDEIQLSVWAAASGLDFLPYVLIGELVNTGVYPASFPDLGFWMTVSNSQVLIDGTQPTLLGPAAVIAPGGVTHTFEAPAGLFGQSVLLQFLVPTNVVGQNGFFVSSDTHEIVF